MTPAEKRYFKRHYGSESNTLTHLYDAINLQKAYDEEAIKAQFPGKVSTNLKVYKFQLEQLLLKSLASHRHFSTTTNKIRMGLEHCDILIEKNLLQMAEKQLEKTKKLCLQTESFTYLPVILQKETQLESIQSQGFSSNYTQRIQEAEHYTQKILAQQLESERLNTIINLYLDQDISFETGDINTHLKELEAKSFKKGLIPTHDKLIREITEAIKAYLLRDKMSSQKMDAALEKLKKNKALRQKIPQVYLVCLRCAIDNGFRQKDYEATSTYINTGLRFSQKKEPLKSQYYYFAAYEIKQQILTDQSSSLFGATITKHEKIRTEFEQEEDLPYLIYLSWIVIASIINSKPKQGLKYLKQIQNLPQDLISFAPALGQILAFIVHFETSNFQQMVLLLDQVKAQKKVSLPREEKRLYSAFLTFIDQLSTKPKMAPEIASKLLDEINEQEKSTFHKVFQYLHLDCWLQAIATESTFVAALSSSV